MGSASRFVNSKIGAERVERIGIAGFTMLARTREGFSYSSEVPTTFLEDGSSVEDTIILNPVALHIEGDVADIYVEREPLQELSETVASTAGSISVFLPVKSSAATQAAGSILASVNDALTVADGLIESGAQVADLFGAKGATGKPLKEQFVDLMESLHLSRQLVDIEMPLRAFSSMRITLAEITRDNARTALSYKLEARQVRVADQALSDVSTLIKNASPAIGGQGQGETDKGAQQGESADVSLLSTILGFG